MPRYAKRTKKTPMRRSRKRNYRRSRGRRNKNLSRPINGAINLRQSPLPENFKTCLRYTEYDKLDIFTANAISPLIFTLNGLYDPNITLTGHQPRGYDQLMAFYNRYMVIGAKATIEMINTNVYPVEVGYSLLSTSVSKTYMSDYMEGATDSQYQTLGGAGSSNDRYKAVINFSPKKYFKKKNLSDDPNMSGTEGVNPSTQAYLHVWTAGQGYTTASADSVWITVTIEYITVFKEPKNVIAS